MQFSLSHKNDFPFERLAEKISIEQLEGVLLKT